MSVAEVLREAYDRDGFGVLPGRIGMDEIERADNEALGLRERRDLISVRNLRCRWQTNVATGACEFETFDPVCDLAPFARGLAHDRRLLDVLAALYGDEACLFKDKLIFKP